ncbi:polynucleotide adenylyltransferase PcnB [Candidatus Neptunochlamydia vexilliferae]|uniref:Poly(A) polymerase I n=1 Tax=Candidatus Neptunichlamydia vexilliferae TaxID=1651774 RepID=A0ABS0B0B4_9BACT|nr:polynucleotide adenylyltransferase PcnB [Candidatus Neptunochlamydia vexilliferae]MBF5059825.1 Poly(A) polymerase I [Candidatus Neptunochlamydia vexilliferae]
MQPKTYSKKEHGIDPRLIDSKALYILEKLRACDHEAYLVGGSVRDLLLRKKPKDFDISTSARPEEIKKLFPSSILIGKRFRLAHVRFGRKIIEVSTFRSGDIENEELITEDNIWGSPEEDVLRRDFTINGLFYDSAKEEVIDYVGGYPDVEKKVIRAIGQPFLRFKQDPVRMIRCLKFQARFGLEVEEEARLALIDCKGEITKSAQARVLEEMLRMLESGHSKSFFQLMTDHGLMQHLLPAIASFLETPDGNEVYAYLEEADKMILESRDNKLERSVLLSCLAFPLLERHLKAHFLDQEKIPHLGDIYQETVHLIHEVFHTFFKIPRRLQIQMLAILTSQYRITPFQKRRKKTIRIPRTPEFPLALQFFIIRCRLEPGLQEFHEEWAKAYEKVAVDLPPPRKRTRRRKPRKRT